MVASETKVGGGASAYSLLTGEGLITSHIHAM
jgi:hypothetical protein